MNKKTLGIYIHIPVCLKKCLYCDFCSYTGLSEDALSQYTDALIREMEKSAKTAGGYLVDSVFFGGGTPTLLPTACFERILESLCRLFSLSPDAEITLEANPKTVTEEKLCALRAMGFNRISIGVQSLFDTELSALGRLHSAKEALATLALATRIFPRVSADLMYGIPGQTVDSFEQTLRGILEGGVSHLSLYGLILEEGTPLFERRGELSFPSEEEECAMYRKACELLPQYGFTHYEISNYAKAGEECRHNLRYWRMGEYLGFGVAAHSYFGGVRYGNGKDLEKYMQSTDLVPEAFDRLSAEDERFEYIMLALRLAQGLTEEDFCARFGVDFWEIYGEKMQKYVDCGYAVRENGRIFLTDAGLYLENAILTDIL